MSLCPCGCGRPAKTPKGYAGRGCPLRAIPPAERAARSRAWAIANPVRMAEIGRQSNKHHRPKQLGDLLDRWATLARECGPSRALMLAYRRGYGAGYEAARRTRRVA